MIADVRLKIELRLRALLERIATQVREDTELLQQVTLARNEYETAMLVSARYRSMVTEEFPGCEITFIPTSVYVGLPEGYPHYKIPVRVGLHALLTECFCPKGLAKKPF